MRTTIIIGQKCPYYSFFDNNTATLVAAVVVTVRIMTTVMSHGVDESRVAEKNRQENQKIAKKKKSSKTEVIARIFVH